MFKSCISGDSSTKLIYNGLALTQLEAGKSHICRLNETNVFLNVGNGLNSIKPGSIKNFLQSLLVKDLERSAAMETSMVSRVKSPEGIIT
ncbi:hypothetical protein V6N11_041856 [Hibiscus sabdariffa]|uniref:Uncharacterized protein n=1 Tax=Hibiscus sabdariffa TaxID=183260 RepID=A0ABR2RM40_9ROSI